ncbi:IS66 family insertion sequence element accessory protein TnpB [Cupriavidus sp. Agwp_2]|uniref:IS66 family insertion sequence element accessory protein TnpB n=1 Tax=Cupriavidus sp. Agwp_2 TaxID=2897324 RepID=UPI00345F89EA
MLHRFNRFKMEELVAYCSRDCQPRRPPTSRNSCPIAGPLPPSLHSPVKTDTRIKLLVHDGFGVWCAARRLNQGRFVWPAVQVGAIGAQLTQAQFDALVLGLPWQRLEDLRAIMRI